MAKFDTIKTAIDANINTNGNQAITGSVMNSVLKQMVDSTDAELTELESETIKNIGDSSYVVQSWEDFEQGTLNGSGVNVPATSRWRSMRLLPLPIINGDPATLNVKKSDDINIFFYWYNADSSFISYNDAIVSSDSEIIPPSSAVYCRITIAPTIEVSTFTKEALLRAFLSIRAKEADSINLLQLTKDNILDIASNKENLQDTIKRTIGIEIDVTGRGITPSGNIGLWESSCTFNKFTLRKGDSVQVTSLTYSACVIAKPLYDSTTPYQPLVNAVTNKPSLPQIYTYTANEDIEIVCSGSTVDTKVVVLSSKSLSEKVSAFSDDMQSLYDNVESVIDIFSHGWNVGAYYESIVQNTSRKYRVIKVNYGERYRIEKQSSEWGGYVYFADENGVIDYVSIVNNMAIGIGVRNGRIPTEMRVTIYHTPELVLTDRVWAGFNVKMFNVTKSPLCKLVVAEWNWGMLNNGVSPQRMEDDKVNEFLPKIKNLIISLGADILYTTEYVKELDRSQKCNTYNEVLKQFYPYYYYGGNMMAIFSKYPFFVQSVTSPDGRNCELGYININGNVIGFGEIHPRSASGTEAEEARIADHQMIVDYFADYDRVIVGGDFNNYEDRELDVYRNAGWNLGNCGYFGNIDTYKPSSRPWYIDNIVTKGINIDNFVKVDNRADISDHYPVVANLSFL